MGPWTIFDLLPGLYVLFLGAGLAWALRRWYDPVPRRVLATFGLVLVLLLGPVLFGGGVLLPLGNLHGFFPFRQLQPAEPPSLGLHADLVHQIAPWALEVRRTLGEGRWPLWNPHAGAGMPLMGDPQVQAFQPFVTAAYPFPYDTAAGITAALRVLAALIFGFLLLRRQGLGEPVALCGSLAYGLGGFLLLWLGWPMANAAAFLPVVLYAITLCDGEGRPRDFLLLSLATASLLLGGHPETLLYAMGFSGLFLLARVRLRGTGGERWRLLVHCGLAMAIAGAAVAPVFLSILDYLPKTERASLVRQHLTLAPLSTLWQDLIKPETLEIWRRQVAERMVVLVAPRAYGDHTFYWGFSNVVEQAGGFVGSATLLAALLALFPQAGRRFAQDRFPQERLALFVLIACLLLLVQPPGLDRILGKLPVLSAMAAPRGQRLLLLVSFCTAFLAACEIERRTRKGQAGSRRPVFAGAAVLAVLVTWGYLANPNPQAPALLAGYRMGLLAVHLGVIALATVLLTLRPGKRAVPWLFCGLVAVELVLVHGPAFTPAPRRLAYPVTPPIRFLLDHLGQDRMVGMGPTTFPANFPLVYGLNDVRIDNPSMPAAYAGVTRPVRRPITYLFVRPGHPLYSLLGVRYVMTRPGVPLPWKRVFSHPAAWIYERPGPLPRLFLPVRAATHPDKDWMDWMERNPDFARRALLPASPEGRASWRAREPRSSSLEVSLLEPARVHARASLSETRLLASNVYQDGHWRLLVNGEPRTTLTANGPFVAAWLPAGGPGEQRIDLLYRPPVFVLGCFLAALAGVAAAVWWIPVPRRVVS